MLQDLEFGRLENEFRHTMPRAEDIVICVSDNKILVQKEADNYLSLPKVEQVQKWADDQRWDKWQEKGLQYVSASMMSITSCGWEMEAVVRKFPTRMNLPGLFGIMSQRNSVMPA